MAIAELNEALRFPRELAGLFLPKDCPSRFELLFLAEMPSMNEPRDPVLRRTNNWNFQVTERDRFLQKMMVKYNVAGCYVTDIVKTRSLPRVPKKDEILKWLPFLLKEIAIIQPRGLVILGKRTYREAFLPYVASRISANIPYDYVFHYSTQVPRKKFERKFAEVITRLLETTAGS